MKKFQKNFSSAENKSPQLSVTFLHTSHALAQFVLNFVLSCHTSRVLTKFPLILCNSVIQAMR